MWSIILNIILVFQAISVVALICEYFIRYNERIDLYEEKRFDKEKFYQEFDEKIEEKEKIFQERIDELKEDLSRHNNIFQRIDSSQRSFFEDISEKFNDHGKLINELRYQLGVAQKEEIEAAAVEITGVRR